jgi:alpha-1,2-mannosyltransferase
MRALRDAPWLTADRATAYCRVIGAVCLAAAVGGLSWSLLVTGGLIDPAGRPLGTDFVSFYAASELALGGQPAAVYAMADHAAAQQRAVGPVADYFAFFYPPIYLLLVLPLATLPYAPALILWLGATGFAYWRAIGALLGRHGPSLAVLAFPALLANAGHGQNAALSAALFGFAAFQMDRRPALAGLCIGLLAYKPQLALLAPFILAAGGRWRTILAAAATVIAVAAATWLAFGTATWTAFLAQAPLASTALAEEMVGSEKMVSVFAAIRMLGGGASTAFAVQACATAAVAIVVCHAARRADGAATGAMLAAAAPLASPFVLDYDLLVIAVPLAWTFAQARDTGFLPWEKTVLGAAFILPILARSIAALTGIPIAPAVLVLLLAVVVRRAAAREA